MNKHVDDFSKWTHRISILVLAITVTLCYTGCRKDEPGEGWPTYRHDASRSGVSSEELPSQLALNWIYTPAHAPKPAWNMPAEEMARMHRDNTYHVSAADGLAYFGSSVDNKVYALNISTGKVKWEFFTEGPVRFSPSIWKNRVYFGSDDGYVYCLNAKNGQLKWKYRPGPKDKIFFFFRVPVALQRLHPANAPVAAAHAHQLGLVGDHEQVVPGKPGRLDSAQVNVPQANALLQVQADHAAGVADGEDLLAVDHRQALDLRDIGQGIQAGEGRKAL